MTVAISTEGLVGAGQGAGGGGTGVALANPSPASGSTLNADRMTARHTAVSFRVLDSGAAASSSSVPWCVWVKYANDDRGYIVYDSATGFMPPFHNLSTWVAATGTLTLLPDGGWPDTIEQICVGGSSDKNIVPIRSGASGSDLPPNHT